MLPCRRSFRVAASGSVALTLSLAFAPGAALASQDAPPAPAAGAPAATGASGAPNAPADAPPISDEELAQILAPVALYPDSLLSQILMAATYPLEIVQADRWAKANAALKGDALAAELEKQTWDPSVRSLVNFPDVLAGLSERLDWTMKVGDAFLADQKRVLDAVQSLRTKANSAGNLKTTPQQNVTVTPATGSQTQTIVIESSKPDVVYVPTYNTTVVYGGWPYPAYPPPPPPYYPPSSAGAAAVGFGVGVACGAAWGYAWGNCNWGGGDVNVNVNQNANFNNNINRANYQNNTANGAWKHDASHRQGAAYRDSATANRYGGQTGAQRTAAANNQYRGRADGASAGTGVGSAGAGRGGAGAAGAEARAGGASGPRPGADGAGAGSRSPSEATSRAPGGGGGALGGGGSGAQTRDASSRGNASRAGAGLSGGASRGGGGGRGGRG